MKYYCLTNAKSSRKAEELARINYPKIKFLYSLKEAFELKKGDTLIFSDVLELDESDKNRIDVIKDNYKKFLNMFITLMFDRSSSCDSEIVLEYASRFSDENALDIVLDMQIESYLNYKYTNAVLKRSSQMLARNHGKSYGRPIGSTRDSEQAKKAKQIILENSSTFKGTLNDIECMKLTNVSRNMFYIYKRQLKKEN